MRLATSCVFGLALAVTVAPFAAADTPMPIAVRVKVVGQGEIRLIVADGVTKPCESSDNHILFQGRPRAGDEIKLKSITGSVCVDHTYGSLRESQWAGPSIWSGSNVGAFGGPREAVLSGAVSTDNP
jgi:hypothetical protein